MSFLMGKWAIFTPTNIWKYVKSTINQVNVECKIFNVRKNITLDGQVPTKS